MTHKSSSVNASHELSRSDREHQRLQASSASQRRPAPLKPLPPRSPPRPPRPPRPELKPPRPGVKPPEPLPRGPPRGAPLPTNPPRPRGPPRPPLAPPRSPMAFLTFGATRILRLACKQNRDRIVYSLRGSRGGLGKNLCLSVKLWTISSRIHLLLNREQLVWADVEFVSFFKRGCLNASLWLDGKIDLSQGPKDFLNLAHLILYTVRKRVLRLIYVVTLFSRKMNPLNMGILGLVERQTISPSVACIKVPISV